jgi:hypothetical protein
MSTTRIIQSSNNQSQTSAPLACVPPLVHHIWFSTPLPKMIVLGEKESDDIFDKLKREYITNKHLPGFRLILWTDNADNSDFKKFIDDNKLNIEIKNYAYLGCEPDCGEFDETDEANIQSISHELSPVGNPGAASDIFRLMILKHLGGFYCDVNDEPPFVFSTSQDLIPLYGCWIGGTRLPSNNILAAVKNHALICETLNIINDNYKSKGFEFILQDRKNDPWNIIRNSGPIALRDGIEKIFKSFSFYNNKKYCKELTDEGKKHLPFTTQQFFITANPNYEYGKGHTWVKAEGHTNSEFLFNDEQISQYNSRLKPSNS